MGPLMQGWPVFEPMIRILIDLESFRPDDHLLRDVNLLVEPALIRKLTACCCAEGKGRPSIDSFVYFRMQRVAYLYGIDSGRRLCEDVYCNLAYRWFCRLSNAHARPGVPADDVGTDVEE
jgi:transposase